MNKSEIGVQFRELDDVELREINGGIDPVTLIIGGIILGAFIIGCVKGCSDEAQNRRK